MQGQGQRRPVGTGQAPKVRQEASPRPVAGHRPRNFEILKFFEILASQVPMWDVHATGGVCGMYMPQEGGMWDVHATGGVCGMYMPQGGYVSFYNLSKHVVKFKI